MIKQKTIQDKRFQAQLEFDSQNPHIFKPIIGIAKRSGEISKGNIPQKKFKDLYKLLLDENLLIQAMARISKNKI
jgi:hypothetical protein